MATLNVPWSYSSLSAALAAAASGDIIVVDPGYAGNEAATVTADNLTIDAPASVSGIVLTLASGVATLTLAGEAPIEVNGSLYGNVIVGNGAANVLNAGYGNDTIDGGAGDDTIVYSGGVDTLNGGSGDDTIRILGGHRRGVIIGGDGSDTVQADDLGEFSFTGVETLDSRGALSVRATVSQLASFGSIVDSLAAATAQTTIKLHGAGGSLDLSSRIAGEHAVKVLDDGLTSGVTIVGSDNDDILHGSAFDDVLSGGDGNDLLEARAGFDVLSGGAGDDLIDISYIGDLEGDGTVDGGAGFDTVRSHDLRDYDFSNVEQLDVFGGLALRATMDQLSQFATITDSLVPADDRITLYVGGSTGGTLDLSALIAGTHSVYVDPFLLTAEVEIIGTDHDDFLLASSNLDTLDGGAGNDQFWLFHKDGDGSGSIDGGAGSDTVHSDDLRDFAFSNVETLEIVDPDYAYSHPSVPLDHLSIYGSVQQLSAFSTITGRDLAADGQIDVFLRGDSGTLDLSTRIGGARSVHVLDAGLTSPVTVMGTQNADIFNTFAVDGTLLGLGGDDLFKISNGSSGYIDGGAGDDTARGGDLGNVLFASVETLDTFGYNMVSASVIQLRSFEHITDSVVAPDSQIGLLLRGSGGVLDLGAHPGTHSYNVVDAGLTRAILVEGSQNDDRLSGSAFADHLEGGDGDDIILGGGGDYLMGGQGDDSLFSTGFFSDIASYRFAPNGVTVSLSTAGPQNTGEGWDTLSVSDLAGSLFDDHLYGHVGANYLFGDSGDDTLIGFEGDDVLEGGEGDDILEGGPGTDTASYKSAPDGQQIHVDLSLTGWQSVASGQQDKLFDIENLIGSWNGDILKGNAVANRLEGRGGDDVLTGGAGADVLDGGEDNELAGDTASYAGSAAAVAVDLSTGSGSGGDAAGDTLVAIENVDGSAYGDTLVGDGGANTLGGLAGNDVLDGGAGDDTLDGGTGNDTASYASATSGVTVGLSYIGSQSTGASGTDTLIGIENLTGSSFDDSLTGDGGANVLIGGNGNDTLYGNGGADSLDGGAGNDTYLVYNSGVTVIEAANKGTDTVWTTLSSYSLGDNLERLVFNGSGAFTGVGNALNNTISGGAGDDMLDGGAGDDRLSGGAGEDTVSYRSAAGAVTVSLAIAGSQSTGGSGRDSLSGIDDLLGSSFDDVLTGNNLANRLDGGDGNDTLAGGGGDDTLDGGAGHDAMAGGAGNDTFIVDDTADSVTEAAGEGTDTVRTSLASYVLGNDIENLILSGPGGHHGTGNGLGNALTGGDGDDLLEGGAGDDTLAGGAGDDTLRGGSGNDTATYAGATAGVTVSLAIAGSQDTVGAGGDTLVDVENLIGTSFGDTLTGKSGANRLVGGAGNDRLDGGAGADRLEGGTGDDTFFVDNAGDVVVELSGEGSDTVMTTLVRYSLGGAVENLVYLGTGNLSGTGNGLDNIIGGGAGDDVLDGRDGNDSLIGGDGNDTASYASAGSAVGVSLSLAIFGGQDTGGAGFDSLVQIENLTGSAFGDTLTGDGGMNVLTGGAGDDVLDGAGGADRMDGGSGNDTFRVDDAGDKVIERAGGGIDTVSTTLASYRLGSNVENLRFAGAGDFIATGNELANAITGGAGDDSLSGGRGGDALDGGSGSDTASYAGATAGIAASLANPAGNTGEAAGDSYVSIENLEGSRYGDVLTGDSGDNRLAGGGGQDTLTGGAGYDTFVFDQTLVAGNVDTIVDFVQGDDGFALSLGIFSDAGPAGLLFGAAFHIGAAAHDMDDRIIYNDANGKLMYDTDGTGAKAAIAFAVVSPGLNLTEYDFRLV